MNAALRIVAIFMAIAMPFAHAAEEHGKTDVFAAPGVTLAWAVARGPDEARTFVVIRIATDIGINRHFTATGRDPFTQAEREWKPATLASGRAELRIPRAAIADFPRMELRFYSGTPGAKPRLEVFYHGVPDTTPEFDDAARLDAYLDDRIARARVR
jgi:hypothetical protein